MYLHLCPGGPGFESASLHNKKARERLPRNTLPQTPQCVGAFSTGYALYSTNHTCKAAVYGTELGGQKQNYGVTYIA
jgi:hypothetical protein